MKWPEVGHAFSLHRSISRRRGFPRLKPGENPFETRAVAFRQLTTYGSTAHTTGRAKTHHDENRGAGTDASFRTSRRAARTKAATRGRMPQERSGISGVGTHLPRAEVEVSHPNAGAIVPASSDVPGRRWLRAPSRSGRKGGRSLQVPAQWEAELARPGLTLAAGGHPWAGHGHRSAPLRMVGSGMAGF